MEAGAAQCLADELVSGGGGPRWSRARVQGLLARARAALARAKPWLPTPAWRAYTDLSAEIQAKVDATAAANPGTGDSLPATGSQAARPTAQQDIRTCACCGKTSLQLMKCGRCLSASYCSRACQKRDWPKHKESGCLPSRAAGGGST